MANRVQDLGHVADAAQPAQDDARTALHLVAELLRLRDLVGARVVLDHRAVAAQQRHRGLDEIADRRGIERHVQGAAQGVDATGRADHGVDAALAAADLLRRADDRANWLIRLGEVFETARCDRQAAQFFENALSSGYYPEALLGMARLAVRRRDKEEARRYLLSALSLEEKCDPQGRTAVELFHTTVGQLMMLGDPRENCVAWVATFPADAQPAALAQRSLMLYATKRSAAEKHLEEVLCAMQPGSPATPAAKLQWREAPKHQQPARPVRESVQSVF